MDRENDTCIFDTRFRQAEFLSSTFNVETLFQFQLGDFYHLFELKDEFESQQK